MQVSKLILAHAIQPFYGLRVLAARIQAKLTFTFSAFPLLTCFFQVEVGHQSCCQSVVQRFLIIAAWYELLQESYSDVPARTSMSSSLLRDASAQCSVAVIKLSLKSSYGWPLAIATVEASSFPSPSSFAPPFCQLTLAASRTPGESCGCHLLIV